MVHDGWHKFNSLMVFIDGGRVVRGIAKGCAVYPYTCGRFGGWDLNQSLSLSAFRARMARGTATMK